MSREDTTTIADDVPPQSRVQPVELTLDSEIQFHCHEGVACFNACCRDLHQALTPYDVLCLARFLEMSTGEFLATYTEAGIGPQTGLPVVSLRFRTAEDLTCPFVSTSGCRVYPARPASCRTYPLARGVSRHRETGRLTERWALIHEPHCLGFDQGAVQTVESWVANQQIADHNRMNDMMLELIRVKNHFRLGPLKPTDSARVHASLYDLDAFRKELLAGGPQGPSSIAAPQDLALAGSDDAALLTIAMTWVQNVVFGLSRESH